MYSVSLNSLDGYQTHDDLLEARSFSEKENKVVLELLRLPFRRLWNITVFAHDCEHHPLVEDMELGCDHDVHVHEFWPN